MKILVAGGLRPDFEKGNAEEICARDRPGQLVNGSYNAFDRLVAEAAYKAVRKQSQSDATAAIHTYVSPGIPSKPAGSWTRFQTARLVRKRRHAGPPSCHLPRALQKVSNAAQESHDA